MQHPPVSNGRTTRPSSVVSRRLFEACIQINVRKEWNFFIREKVLSFVGSFFDFLAGQKKKKWSRTKERLRSEEGRESERHVCPKERKKDSPSLSLSLLAVVLVVVVVV